MTSTVPIRTLADLLQRLGEVPLDRIRFRPWPGSAGTTCAALTSDLWRGFVPKIMSEPQTGFIREDPWRIFRIMAEFVAS